MRCCCCVEPRGVVKGNEIFVSFFFTPVLGAMEDTIVSKEIVSMSLSVTVYGKQEKRSGMILWGEELSTSEESE